MVELTLLRDLYRSLGPAPFEGGVSEQGCSVRCAERELNQLGHNIVEIINQSASNVSA